MKIVICGSMSFAKEMLESKEKLEKKGHLVIVPEFTEKYAMDPKWQKKARGWGTMIGARRKISHNLIKKHFNEIVRSDGVLVINKDKNRIKNYIGGNSFLEMGFAYVFGKKIFVLNSLPKQLGLIYQELVALRPIVLNGSLSKIK